jgi:hypothetical protein
MLSPLCILLLTATTTADGAGSKRELSIQVTGVQGAEARAVERWAASAAREEGYVAGHGPELTVHVVTVNLDRRDRGIQASLRLDTGDERPWTGEVNSQSKGGCKPALACVLEDAAPQIQGRLSTLDFQRALARAHRQQALARTLAASAETASASTAQAANAPRELPVPQTEPPSTQNDLPVPQSEPAVAQTQLPVPQSEPVVAQTQLPAPQSEPAVAQTELPVAQAEPAVAQTEAPVAQAEPPAPVRHAFSQSEPAPPVRHAFTRAAPNAPGPAPWCAFSKVSQVKVRWSEIEVNGKTYSHTALERALRRCDYRPALASLERWEDFHLRGKKNVLIGIALAPFAWVGIAQLVKAGNNRTDLEERIRGGAVRYAARVRTLATLPWEPSSTSAAIVAATSALRAIAPGGGEQFVGQFVWSCSEGHATRHSTARKALRVTCTTNKHSTVRTAQGFDPGETKYNASTGALTIRPAHSYTYSTGTIRHHTMEFLLVPASPEERAEAGVSGPGTKLLTAGAWSHIYTADTFSTSTDPDHVGRSPYVEHVELLTTVFARMQSR